MPHAFMYHGAFEHNFATLRPGAKTFRGTDGSDHPLPPWPADATGVRIGYMEKPGKRFVAVRVMDDKADIVLRNEVLVDPDRHLGPGKRFGAQATVVGDDVMKVFLKEAGAKNREQIKELVAIRGRMD